jgi:mannosylglycoprotein endo-beta-mannosidase
MINAVKSRNTNKYTEHLEKPITAEELLMAIRKGAPNKSPGVDGLGIEFYRTHWDTIGTDQLELMNHMFIHQKITPNQKHGIIICLPKDNHTRTPDGYRPISLLTTEYKILARIMAARLNIVAQEHLHKTQYC